MHTLCRALLPAVLLLAACAAPETASAPETAPLAAPVGSDLDALLWMRTSAEYHALCLQAFAIARPALERALADKTWTACEEQGPDAAGKPPAIIVDIDETTLDTTVAESREMLGAEDAGTKIFDAWSQQADAPPLPGARDFLQAAAARGVTIFYVTNRADTLHDVTRLNLQRAGLPLRPDRETVLCRTTTSDKGPRRAIICRDFRVLLLFGDAGGDFTSTMAPHTPAERREVAAGNATMWGQRWIVLPNPDYGDWKRAVLGWKTMTRAERLAAERKALEETLPAK